MWWTYYGQQQSTPTATHSVPSPVWWAENRRKMRRHVGWDKDRLIGKAKAMFTNKAKQRIHSPLPIIGQVLTHLQGSRVLLCILFTWEDKCYHPESVTPFLFLSPSFICWAQQHMVWNVPLVSWGQLSQLCLLSTPCAPPAYSLLGGVMSREDLDSV